MASTPTTRLRYDKQATGDNPNAWGVRLNAALELIDESFGYVAVAVAGAVTLTSNNFSSDQSRRSILRLTGAGGFTVTVPAVEKFYIVDNRCTASVTIKTASGAGAVCRAGLITVIYLDGTDASAADPRLDQVKTPTASVALGGQRITGLANGVADTDAAAVGQLAPFAAAAEDSAEAAEDSATLAQAWATQLVGEVMAGQGYSARYWAAAAAASAAAAALFDPSTYYTKTQVDGFQALKTDKTTTAYAEFYGAFYGAR